MRKAVGFPHHGGVVKGARKPPATQCTDEPGEFQRSLHVAPLMPEGANFPAGMVDFQYDCHNVHSIRGLKCTHNLQYQNLWLFAIPVFYVLLALKLVRNA